MSWTDFFIVLGCCALTMLACRCLPLFLLKGKKLPDSISDILGYIPPAAFAALVANDLLTPGMFSAGLWPAIIPFLASLAVIVTARSTKSLLCCAAAGVVMYALLSFI